MPKLRSYRACLIAGAAVVGFGPGALAQQAGAGDGEATGVQDIVVTARRVDENLQRVPISVAALSPAELVSRQITNINDLKGAVAGFSSTRTTTPGNGVYTLRGQTNTSLPTPAADNGIGLYLDGIYLARGRGVGTDVPDLARVEVLRGPQGTLFGRNSSAGAINFITNVPGPELEIKANLLYGNFNRLRAGAIVNLPVTDDLAIRVLYQHHQEDGDVRNTTTSPGHAVTGFGSYRPQRFFSGYNSENIVAKLRYTGIEGLTVDYKFDWVDTVEYAGPNQLIGFLGTPISAFAGTFAALIGSQAPGAVLQSFNRLGAINEDAQAVSPIRASGHMLTLDYALSDTLSVKTISALRRVKSPGFFGLDGADWRSGGASFCVSCTAQQFRQKQFSQENQLIGDFGQASFIIGTYYFREKAQTRNAYIVGRLPFPEPPASYTPVPGDFTTGEDSLVVNKAYALYAHGEYEPVDDLRFAVGARYTIDKRRTDDVRVIGRGLSQIKYERFTYDAAVNYNLSSSAMVYAKYSTGYVSGGTVASVPFRPEDSKQAEIGFKGDFFDRRLRLNASAYYSWIKDRQNSLPSVNTAVNPTLAAAGYTAPFPLGILVFNIPGTTKIKGFEIEATAVPIDGLTLTANYGYNDPKFSIPDRVKAPKTQFSFSVQYDSPRFGNDSYLSFRLDGDYRGSFWPTGATNTAVFTGDVPAALRPGYATSADYLNALGQAVNLGDYWLVNARMSLVDLPVASTKVKLSAFVRNIFNEDHLMYAANYGFSINGAFERPRTYGLELDFAL